VTNNLYNEFATALTGADCPATAAWLQAALRADCPAEALRAEAHWSAADEALQYAIGSHLGISEPGDERCPVPLAIRNDYDALMARASHLLAE